MAIAISSESRSASVRNRDRHHLGTLIAIARNTQLWHKRHLNATDLLAGKDVPSLALKIHFKDGVGNDYISICEIAMRYDSQSFCESASGVVCLRFLESRCVGGNLQNGSAS
jgi:hypothetical protein